MYAVAGGMESESDEDGIYLSSVSPSHPPQDFRAPQTISSVQAQAASSPLNSTQVSLKKNEEIVPESIEDDSSTVIRRLRRNNARGAPRRRRAVKDTVFDDLRYAILQGNLDVTKQLYESNDIDVDTILKSGWTGLMYACSVGHADIANFLLQRHANPNYHRDMFTPLMSVCISKKSEDGLLQCCKLLLEYGANVNVHDRCHTTPLIFAAREGHTEIVRLLLEHGANPDASENRGYTALAWAAYFGHGPVVRVLLEKGADRNKINNMGQTPANIALDNDHKEVASLLMQICFTEDGGEEQPSIPNGIKKSISNSPVTRSFDNSKSYTKLGQLDLFLIGIDCRDLIEKFTEHQLTFQDLLIMDDEDLEKIGVSQVGLRKKILEACKAVHKKDWQNSSLPNLRKNHYISCPDAVAMVANISKHLKYISTSVVYIRNQIQAQPRILELSRESANIHNLMDEVEDSLKNLHTLKDEMRFLKMHLVKVQYKPEYSSNDCILETVPKGKTKRVFFVTFGLATMSVIVAGVCWKYPHLLSPPSIHIRIPFLR